MLQLASWPNVEKILVLPRRHKVQEADDTLQYVRSMLEQRRRKLIRAKEAYARLKLEQEELRRNAIRLHDRRLLKLVSQKKSALADVRGAGRALHQQRCELIQALESRKQHILASREVIRSAKKAG